MGSLATSCVCAPLSIPATLLLRLLRFATGQYGPAAPARKVVARNFA
jgi:hypothetical protein